jgi:hypothetical protein
MTAPDRPELVCETLVASVANERLEDDYCLIALTVDAA